MSHRRSVRRLAQRALAVAVSGGILAAPASADPVVPGPAVPDELAVLAVGGAAATPSDQTDQVALHRVATADGAYRGRVVFPTDALTKPNAAANSQLSEGALRRSADGRLLTFTAARAPLGQTYPDVNNATAVQVAADGTWTDTRLGAGLVSLGQQAFAAVTVDGSRSWVATNSTSKPLGTIAPGDTAMTRVSATLDPQPSGLELVDGSLIVTTANGVARLPGGLPSALDTVTVPQRIITIAGARDTAFVDADGVPGADTAYVTRGLRGLFKYVLDGGEWKLRGYAEGGYGWITARAVAGAIEIYTTTPNNLRVRKLVDTAPIGGALTTTGATTIARPPARVRYVGLAFAPGTGFAADPAPYPETPPALRIVDVPSETHVGANAAIELDVVDPNPGDLTVTATSNNQAVLPDSRITIPATGATRSVRIDPIAAGTVTVTFRVGSGADQVTAATGLMTVTGPAPDPTAHYYSVPVDLSAALDVGDGYFLGISDEVNQVRLFKKGVSGFPVASFYDGFPGGETDFEGVTRVGDTVIWTGSHGNNRSGGVRPERRFLAFTTITGSGLGTDLKWRNGYSRLWQQWKDWDAANGHGLGANKLKFNTATVANLLPNAPFGFNVEGLTTAPDDTTAWFGMRAPTITGADGVERALILPVNNIAALTSDAVNAQFGAPIFLDLGGRSIRDINKNAHDQYLITAGTGDTDDSLKNWALYTWDGDPAHAPVMVNELPTNETEIGAWEGIVDVPDPLVAGARVLLTADSGDTGLRKSYGQYLTLGAPMAGPALVTGVTAAAEPGAVKLTWEPAARAERYRVTATAPDGTFAPGTPAFVDGTSTLVEGLTAGTEYAFHVRAQNAVTRTPNSATVKATPTTGARVATTTALTFSGSKVVGESQKLVATLSDPTARGTVQFFADGSLLSDAFARDPQGAAFVARSTFRVVDGKAEIDITGRRQPGVWNLQAKFTTANAENFGSSDSATAPTFFEYRPKLPWAEVVAVTGDRVVGGRVGVTVKVHGYTPTELSLNQLTVDFGARLSGATARTRLVGDTAASAGGQVPLNPDGEATIYTTALPAGDHRLSVFIAQSGLGFVSMYLDELPFTVGPAGSPAPPVASVKRPSIAVVWSGPGVQLVGQPLTLTARVSDPALAGTVQFHNGNGSNIGTPVPVVNGVATYTGNVTPALVQVLARFEPSEARTTTASPVSFGVARMRATTLLPFPAAVATTTTLALAGSTATATVSPVGGDALAIRDVNGYVEVLEGERVVGFGVTRLGVAKIDLSGLGAGGHTLRARYVPSDATRSLGSEQVVTVAGGGTGGTVPATLALSLGAPARFAPFVPGVAKEYTAGTSATVISTAGDAALTVSEPGHLVNGAFSLAQPLRVELSRAAWAAPVSNDVVDVTFKQAIGATDPLRTGTYSKTLTFTLSTTQP